MVQPQANSSESHSQPQRRRAITEVLTAPPNLRVVEAGAIDEPPAEPPIGLDTIPEHLLDVGGLMGRIIGYCVRTAYKPNPPLALAGALALMGTITGRKACHGDTTTKIYAIAVAGTAEGKEHPRKVNDRLLTATGLGDLLGGENLNSHAGILAALEESPVLLCQLDEMGRYLAAANSKSGLHAQTALTALLKLFTGENYHGEMLSDRRLTRKILRHHFCVYGSSTPGNFFDALSPTAISDGLLGRCLFFPGVPKAEFNPAWPPERGFPPGLLDGIAAWRDFLPGHLRPARATGRAGHGGGEFGADDPDVVTLERLDRDTPDVPLDEAAAEHLLEFRDRVEEVRRAGSQWIMDLRGRDLEKALRLALIKACSDCSPGPGLRITLAAARWACELVDWQSQWLLFQAEDRIVDKTPLTHSEQVAKVRRWLRERPGRRASGREIARKFHWTSRIRDEVLLHLEEAGLIRVTEAESRSNNRESCPQFVYELL